MKLMVRTLALTSFIASLVAAGLAADPSLAEESGFDFWNVSTYHEQIRSAQLEHRELHTKDQVVLQRALLKVEITEEILAGHLDVDEALARFEDVNRQLPTGMKGTLAEEGQTERKIAARQMISYVRSTRKPEALALAEEWECILSCRE